VKDDNKDKTDASTVQLVVKETKDLVKALEGTSTRRVRLHMAGMDIEVERQEVTMVAGAPMTYAPAAGAPAAGAAPGAAPGRMPVVAPLVGVFSRSASPGAKPFVDVGDTVERGQKVGIVEAMKMMNEVTSDFRGTVAEIVVANGETVQYEQTLMFIDVSGGK
jgi:acetyl-CoA carboxylase biotin carboxyl carrier protein